MFFFSSRRRHTRYWRDWSSDVCSSDLLGSSMGTRDELVELLTFCAERGVRPVVDSVHGFSDAAAAFARLRSEEHTSELQSRQYLVCRLLLEKKRNTDRVS